MTLTDESPMPFGKHQGKKMEDVPASYLLWLNDQLSDSVRDGQPLSPKQKQVKAYIQDNLNVLQKEAKE